MARNTPQPNLPKRSMPSGSAPSYPNVVNGPLIHTPPFNRPGGQDSYPSGPVASPGAGTRGVSVGIHDYNNPNNAGRFDKGPDVDGD